ncbi:MAG: helix-hairpin-helix domain-containing protein [Cyclobacteriaceae bacterium]
MKGPICISTLLLAATVTFAQDYPRKEVNLQNLVDEILAIQSEDLNYEDLYENFAQLLSNPADLNLVTREQLQSLFFLNESQIQSLLAYREEAGPFLSVYELQNVNGINRDTFLKLVSFVTVTDLSTGFNRSLWKRILQEKNNYLIFRYDRTLEEKKGYQENTPPGSRYAGSPDRLYTRFRTSRPGDFSLGITMEKDGGEKNTWAPSRQQYGTDFLSFHAQVLNKGKIKNLILGDYQAQFGQGLILGSAFGIGKSAEAVTTIRRPNIGFMPYTSLYEAGYFRGGALSLSINKRVTVHGMFSYRGRDGNVDEDSTTDNTLISSITYTGLHRTLNEIANRNILQEKNMASVINYKDKALDAGFIIHYTEFNFPVIKKPTVYNQFYFQGSRNTNGGMFLNYTYRNFAFFSEAAHTFNEGFAVTAGIIGSLTPSLDISLHYRKFDRNYQSFYSNALAESSTPQNERGIYWGWKYVVNKKYSFSGYFDLFKFPWLRYGSYSPSEGSEWLLRFNYKPSRNILLFVQATQENKLRNLPKEGSVYLTAPGIKRNYWINLDYAATSTLSFKTRAQFNTYELGTSTTQGMVVLQDVTWSYRKITISGRYALIDTDDYDNRLYVYEKDVWLAFTFPAYYGVGIKNYLMLQYAVSKKIDLWLRWGYERYTDRETIGSGGETIEGNTQNDLRFQTRIRI